MDSQQLYHIFIHWNWAFTFFRLAPSLAPAHQSRLTRNIDFASPPMAKQSRIEKPIAFWIPQDFFSPELKAQLSFEKFFNPHRSRVERRTLTLAFASNWGLFLNVAHVFSSVFYLGLLAGWLSHCLNPLGTPKRGSIWSGSVLHIHALSNSHLVSIICFSSLFDLLPALSLSLCLGFIHSTHTKQQTKSSSLSQQRTAIKILPF